ncbi:hypothetical protein H1S01_03395 [Heliobacterium chlorum]|uniref:Copper amine oxidase-like N-terminal domain-containing protein n=1 Tax=Heliobacterium chlorum TaxID=2698 RepID=A0ABR7SYE8_HELCL|nr:stalk domain-containing protein [Heliobacterium chlorum]MBC9783557.1 hypothetical protein [Heliobacterium chlorum]
MKKFLAGIIVGAVLATSTVAIANNPVKLVVNGQDITSAAEPILHNDKTYVPARPLAEALGANVKWDRATNTVTVTSETTTASPVSGIMEKKGDEAVVTGDWVKTTQIAEKYGLRLSPVKSGFGVGLYQGEKLVEFEVPKTDGIYNVNDVAVKVEGGRIFFQESELKTKGFIPQAVD